MRIIILLVLGCSSLLGEGYSSSKESLFSSIPTWVNQIDIPELNNCENNKSPQRYLLYDTQIRAVSKERFQRFAIYLTNQKSVQQDSQIEISFDPSYESVKLHDLSIVRDGQKINKQHSSSIQVLQRELELESHILNGRHSLIILIDDVRVGDIISYSYTTTGKHLAYQNHFFTSHDFRFSTPVERNYFRVLLPMDWEVTFKNNEGSWLSYQKVANASNWDWVFDVRGQDVTDTDFDLQSPSIEMSDFKGWGEVASLFTPYYSVSESKSKSRELSETALKLTANSTSKRAQALKLLQFVQNEIRYFGTELGDSAFYPVSPSKILNQRRGDCKDKVMLLKSLLKEVGIPSTPLLVSSYLNEKVFHRLPNPSTFDHVILHIEIDGKSYIVDPTYSLQGGALDALHLPAYAYGLALKDNESHLMSLPSPDPASTGIYVETSYKPENNDTILIECTSTYKGSEADYFRGLIHDQGKNSLIESYQSFLSQAFGEVANTQWEHHDELDKNVIVLKESYLIKQTDKSKPLLIYPHSLWDYLTQKVDLTYKGPLFQTYPKNIREKISFSSPVAFPPSKKSKTYNHPWGCFSYSIKSHKNTFTLECDYQSKSKRIAPEEVTAFRTYINSISSEIPHEVTLPSLNASEERISYQTAGFTFLILAIVLIVCGFIILYLKKMKHPKDQWLRQLSLLKKP